jgi:hypothetical protein
LVRTWTGTGHHKMKYLPIKTRERSRNPNAKQPRYNLNAAKIVCFFAGGGGGRGGTLNSVTATRAPSEARRRFPTYHQQYSSWFTPQKVNRHYIIHYFVTLRGSIHTCVHKYHARGSILVQTDGCQALLNRGEASFVTSKKTHKKTQPCCRVSRARLRKKS